MMRRVFRWTLAGTLLLSASLYQGCTIVVRGYPPVFINLHDGFPHFDGDGEDSFLDRFFGFDDDD
jgi:hypothetical protein